MMANINNKITLDQIKYAHTLTFENKEILTKSNKCGCIYCLEIFSFKELDQDLIWIDNENTALCPYCMVDVVIPESEAYPLTKEFLQKAHDYWFEAVDNNLTRHVISLYNTRVQKYWNDFEDEENDWYKFLKRCVNENHISIKYKEPVIILYVF